MLGTGQRGELTHGKMRSEIEIEMTLRKREIIPERRYDDV